MYNNKNCCIINIVKSTDTNCTSEGCDRGNIAIYNSRAFPRKMFVKINVAS